VLSLRVFLHKLRCVSRRGKTGGFTGYEALQQHIAKGPSQQIVSLSFADESVVPLGHEPVIYNNDIIGKTTTCAFGYRIGKPIALAQVTNAPNTGEQVEVDIAGTLSVANVDLAPLFDPNGIRMKG